MDSGDARIDEAARAEALAATRTRPPAAAMPTHRAVTAWLLDRGLSHAEIEAIPTDVKLDYLELWREGLVGPLAQLRPFWMLLLAQGVGKNRPHGAGDIFPELRHVYEDL